MKKLALNLKEVRETLSREQLKQETGSTGVGIVQSSRLSGFGSFSGCVNTVQECWGKC